MLLFVQLAEDMVDARLDPGGSIEPVAPRIRRADGIHVSKQLGRGSNQIIGTHARNRAWTGQSTGQHTLHDGSGRGAKGSAYGRMQANLYSPYLSLTPL